MPPWVYASLYHPGMPPWVYHGGIYQAMPPWVYHGGYTRVYTTLYTPGYTLHTSLLARCSSVLSARTSAGVQSPGLSSEINNEDSVLAPNRVVYPVVIGMHARARARVPARERM